MKKILVPTDFSEYAYYALKVAAQIAKKNDGEIILLHMLELPHQAGDAIGSGHDIPEIMLFKNAAMKKLFADPHFNVMDRMDIYIDDYGQSDPIPEAMLRQMVGAKFLNLFEDEDPKVVAQSVPAPPVSNTEPLTNDHTDLRLQPDPTSGPQGTEPKPV